MATLQRRMDNMFAFNSCTMCPGAWQARGVVHCCPISHQYCTRPGLPDHEELTRHKYSTAVQQVASLL